MIEKRDILESLKKLRKEKERKFDQSVDLIINLKNFNIKKDSVNLSLNLPHKIKETKICAFLENKSENVDTITQKEFIQYKDKKKMKKLVKKYDYFIASAKLMPNIATIFGRVLGPAGKMPSPPDGVIMEESEDNIKRVIKKFEKIIKIRSKEPSLKFCIGKESMKDEEVADNIEFIYKKILDSLPRKKDNIKSVLIKLTMTKPIKLKI